MRSIILVTLLLVISAMGYAEDRASSLAGREEPHVRNAVLPPFVSERYEYHEVCGCCEKDLQCAMSHNAIRWKDGDAYDSITNWKVKWDYTYDRDAASCRTKSFRVRLDVTIHLPKWTCAGHAPEALTKKWESYIANLTLHEQGHRDKALTAAEDLTRAVADMPPPASCSELDRKVEKLCNDRMKQLDKEQEAYDAETEHGQVRGVAFP